MNSQFQILTSDNQEQRVVEYEKQLKEYEQLKKQRNYEKCGVPEKFYTDSIDTYVPFSPEEEKNKAGVVAFIENPQNHILLLCGQNGNGKTHLACSVLRVHSGLYTTASKICIEYESATGFNAIRTREELLISLSKCSMLVIDECGKYTLNPDLERFLLSQIITSRYENNRPTVLVTNENKKKYIEFLGKSVFDRMTEVCITLDFTGKSKRQEFRK